MTRRMIVSFSHALRGLKYLWRHEANFRVHCSCAFLVLAFAALWRFTAMEFCFLLLAIVLVIGSETINTIIEDAYDTLHPKHHELVGKVKDMMAAFVLLNAFAAIVIGALTVWHHVETMGWRLF